MQFLEYFSRSYGEAQNKFLDEVTRVGASLSRYVHPEPGPAGEELVTHVARIGSPLARKVLVLSAGTHGAEGLPGSACLIGWLRNKRFMGMGEDMAAVLIHFVNPYGVAYRCRQTEGNVDLNRNFVAHGQEKYPENPLYAEAHEALLAKDAAERKAAKSKFIDAHGQAAFNTAVLTGQYDFSDGLFYGGRSPVWSNHVMLRIMEEQCAKAQEIAHVDFHTGLGPYGYGFLVNNDEPGSGELALARSWYGKTLYSIPEARDENDAEGGSPIAVGDMCGGLRQFLHPRRYIYVALEYGTYDIDRFIEFYSAYCRHLKYGGTTQEEEKVRSDFQDFFYPQSEDWKEMIWTRAEQVTRQAMVGLKAI